MRWPAVRLADHLVYLVVYVWVIFISDSATGVAEFCEGESYEDSCKHDEVLVVQNAVYGRMRLGRCVRMNMGYIGCYAEVLDLADQRCSGRRKCEIKVPDTDFEQTQPCFELKSYLEISSLCVKVATARPQVCQEAKYVSLKAQSAHLSSQVTMETGCGSRNCPWVIEVKPGQRINVTLWDFGWRQRKSTYIDDDTIQNLQVCQKYATIRELNSAKSVEVCGSIQRESVVYVSTSHQLEVFLTPRMMSAGASSYYILKYEAIGCPNIEPPRYAVFRREGDIGYVKCRGSTLSWKLECRGSTWSGTYGNCTRYQPRTSGRVSFGNMSMPYGVAIAIVVGVAIVIGMLILTVGLVIFKRHTSRAAVRGHHRRTPHSPNRPLPQIPIPIQYQEGREDYLAPSSVPDCASDPPPNTPLKSPGSITSGSNSVKKNDYNITHIWEAPLPTPKDLPDMETG